MSPAKVAEYWRWKVYAEFGEAEAAGSTVNYRGIQRNMKRDEEDDGAAAPNESTVRRWHDDWTALPEVERQAFQSVTWPSTFDRQLIGWDVAPAILRELANMDRFGKRMSLRWARWFERLWRSAPDAPSADLHIAASALAAMEILGGPPPDRLRACELWLAYRGWDVSDAQSTGRRAYHDAIERAGVSPWVEGFGAPPGADPELVARAIAEFEPTPMSVDEAKAFLNGTFERTER